MLYVCVAESPPAVPSVVTHGEALKGIGAATKPDTGLPVVAAPCQVEPPKFPMPEAVHVSWLTFPDEPKRQGGRQLGRIISCSRRTRREQEF
jgi:hypothetical protein